MGDDTSYKPSATAKAGRRAGGASSLGSTSGGSGGGMFAPMKPGMFASAMGFNPVKIGAADEKPVEEPKPAAAAPPPKAEERPSALSSVKTAADLSLDDITPLADVSIDEAPRAQAAPRSHEAKPALPSPLKSGESVNSGTFDRLAPAGPPPPGYPPPCRCLTARPHPAPVSARAAAAPVDPASPRRPRARARGGPRRPRRAAPEPARGARGAVGARGGGRAGGVTRQRLQG